MRRFLGISLTRGPLCSIYRKMRRFLGISLTRGPLCSIYRKMKRFLGISFTRGPLCSIYRIARRVHAVSLRVPCEFFAYSLSILRVFAFILRILHVFAAYYLRIPCVFSIGFVIPNPTFKVAFYKPYVQYFALQTLYSGAI